ncbi:MAG: C4-type zinc ribbon domain-containing protein [Actinomycetota bacterium]|nr:C4-type zinc ribbon domain-containing protein [Actinomycetota bacterium]
MNAAPDVQLRLLDVQAHDSAIDRLAQRRRTLAELAELADLDSRLAIVRDQIVAAETELSDRAREQRKVENDVDMVRIRMARDQQRLDAGQVTSPRELENLQHELGSLARRQADLEDQVLEAMEQAEGIETLLAGVRAEQAALNERRGTALERRDAVWAEIDADSERATEERSALAADLPGELTALYEKIRADSGGLGAAALARGQCGGCRLTLSPVDLGAIRKAPPEEVLRCEECRRILVRTPESGLGPPAPAAPTGS